MISFSSPQSSRFLSWMRQNLFNNWFNGFLTLLSLCLLIFLTSGFLNWAFTQAQWTVIGANLRLFLVGIYPVNQLWRTWATLAVMLSVGGMSWGMFTSVTPLFNRTRLLILGNLAVICGLLSLVSGWTSSLILWVTLMLLMAGAYLGRQLQRKFPQLSHWFPMGWLLAFIFCLWLLLGGGILPKVRLDDLSGLILTLLVASVSIILSFPVGILLALGRQSSLPVIRWISTLYIELIRGLPLIGILFMAQVMLPLVLPVGVRPDRVVRAIAGFTIFSAAYLAENVRGGLQSIPRGQTEAAKALGLGTPLVLGLIILPQALRAVIPSIVGQFISLFKDTSLLAIVGLVDLLGISQSILANRKFIGTYAEVYLFIALIYWGFCRAMSYGSRKLEVKR